MILLGMVGLDTSHCSAFARILRETDYEYHLPGARLVGAFPGGSELFALSRDRVEGFTRELRSKYEVPLYDSIDDLAHDVDAILLLSGDGRQHLEQFREMAIGKPVFIDKPLAVSSDAARELIMLAGATDTPIMSSSALRYAAGIADLVDRGAKVASAESFGPATLLADYPGLFWYGIHSAEILFSFMGPGCRTVRCLSAEHMDVIIGEWGDGRLGVVRGTRLANDAFGCVVHTDAGATCGIAKSTPPYYFLLLKKVLEFLRTGQSPVSVEETFEIIAFIEAADISKTQGGTITRTASM
jgi:predicted dehydrogenase